MPFSSDADVFDGARPWQWRIVRASAGQPVGGIVLAMLGKQPTVANAYGLTADIWPDGRVATKIRRHGIWSPHAEPIGTSIQVRDELRRLADHCKLNDADRQGMFMEFQKWIRKDFRAKSEA